MSTTLKTDHAVGLNRLASTPGKNRNAARWTLNRAGIINVYQYGDEILQFGGGRLLLRGVNGSGKSTAMNMLLPFLLEGDTRRIDAAGEQSGVLRSWMLAGRDEPQPQGYLWLEVANGDAYLAFGCGIRANRSTDQVTTWWFITSRRPGIDLHLVEGRVPVSKDVLRAAIGPDPVFGHEQRADYRRELRKRLFGGADLEQYLHLLHVVRNPRVGDRLDTELPQYLQDALPQLSDAALDDAAQPLEDLEEHRKNVSDLRSTAEALDAIQAVYRNYARTELHRLADRAADAARTAYARRRDEEKARETYAAAVRQREHAQTRKRSFGDEVELLGSEIAALEASEAYKSGAQLNDLRTHVGSLEKNATAAEVACRRHDDATARASKAIDAARSEAYGDYDALRKRVSALASLASGCRLSARPPDVAPIGSQADPSAGLELPLSEPVATTAADAQLAVLRSAARQRLDEVETVTAALRDIEPAERAVRDAERARKDAETVNDKARETLADARTAFQSVIREWQMAAADWIRRATRHNTTHGLPAAAPPAEIEDVASEIVLGRSVSTVLEPLVEPAIRYHESRRAELEALLNRQLEEVEEIGARVAVLAAKSLPDPLLLAWQQRIGRSFAELIDFAEHVEPAARAGLEAALEASGLLAAEVRDDGALQLADGQLVVTPLGAGVPAPLGGLLRADISDADSGGATKSAVERILAAISTDPACGADTVVTSGGEFRIGAVRGKHRKAEAEHIGITARRAALERLRAEAARALEEAEAVRDRLAAERAAADAALAEARSLRTAIPPDRDLHTSLLRRGNAETLAGNAEQHLRERRTELEAAEHRHGDAVVHAHATAARLSLPAAFDELRGVRADLERIAADVREAQSELVRLARAVERWRERGEHWRAARTDEEASREHLASVSSELTVARERLATLDAAIGIEYRKIAEKIRDNTARLMEKRKALGFVETELEQALRDEATAQIKCETAAGERQGAEVSCAQTFEGVRRALDVPGLVAAAVDAPGSDMRAVPADVGNAFSGAADASSGPVAATAPSVPVDVERVRADASAWFSTGDGTPAGVRRLAEAMRARIPQADPPASAEGVRLSIRARRDTLGAGWDADGRQPDEHLPLHVEVTGPLAAQKPLPEATEIVRRQLDTMTSLLSAKQHQALRNLLQGLVAREVAIKLHDAAELIQRMNERLSAIATSHGIGVRLRWRRRDDLEPELAATIELLAKLPDLRTADEDRQLADALGQRIDDAHREDPGTPYRELIARVLDYRSWHSMILMLHRAGHSPERLTRRTALSEGEKKIVSYLPLFAAVAASCDGIAAAAPESLRFVLLDDAFAKVSEDNHAKLFGLLVELDLDFIVTSERLWGTHETVPELAITEVIRDAALETIVLEHSRWDAQRGERA
jgi:hypothetical protein